MDETIHTTCGKFEQTIIEKHYWIEYYFIYFNSGVLTSDYCAVLKFVKYVHDKLFGLIR